MSGNRARGGRAEFSWDKVKEQSFGERSHYLGASVHARNERGLGNPQWYLDDGKDTAGKHDSLRKEVDEVKRREEELMREALGLPPLHEGGERKEKEWNKQKKEKKDKKEKRKDKDDRRKERRKLRVKK